MNRELIGLMAKFDITKEKMATVIGASAPTFRKKLETRMFTQSDIDKMLNYLRRYDKTISENAFFNELQLQKM